MTTTRTDPQRGTDPPVMGPQRPRPTPPARHAPDRPHRHGAGGGIAPNGRTLATTSADQTVRLWDLSDRHRPRPPGTPLTGHTNEVYGVAFAPDGRTLATTSDDRTVRLWDLPRLEGFHGDEVREACLRTGGSLDKATWDQYAPGVSYQDTCADR